MAPETGRLLTSVERAGRALYRAQKCDECHTILGAGGDTGPDLSDIGMHHSSAWIHSFLEQPALFRGDTTEMPSFGPPTLTHQQIEELAQYLASLRGGPASRAPPEIHDTFPPPRRGSQ